MVVTATDRINSQQNAACKIACNIDPLIRARARGRFFNLVDLVNQLEQEKAAGRSGRLIADTRPACPRPV